MAVFTVNNSNNRFTLKLTVEEYKQYPSSNVTQLDYTLDLIANTSWHFQTFRIGSKVVLGGKAVHDTPRSSASYYDIEPNGTLRLAEGRAPIEHNADGTKNLTVEYSIDMASADYSPGALSSTGNMDLTPIPREATITAVPDFTDEQNPTITYSNLAGNSVDSLQISIARNPTFAGKDTAYRDVSKTGTSYTFVFTEAERDTLRNLLSSRPSQRIAAVIKTVIAGVEHTNMFPVTLSIVNANPVFTAEQITYKDTSVVADITYDDQLIVQNKSSLEVTFTAAQGAKFATISKYELTINGVTKTATESGSVPFGKINSSRDVDLTLTVTDSRGNKTTVTKTIAMLSYSAPTMAVTLERLNNYEDETYLTVDASVAYINGQNTTRVEYAYKQKGDPDDYPKLDTIENRIKQTISCDKNYAYTFYVKVTDAFGEYCEDEFTLAKGKFPLFIDTEKNAVGINEFPGENEALRVKDGVARFDDGIVLVSASKKFLLSVSDSGVLQITEIQ